MELLSPAGNLEAGLAAFRYGADAVYLGLQDFSARADADNFTPEDLNTLLGIAHRHPVPRKVYVAVNTLVRQDELPQLVRLLAQLSEMTVDALIIQDWAVLRLVREHFPNLPVHASTQLAIHNVAGALQARDLGFSRIVCARELTLPELDEISRIPNLETEAFIHGALCYAYSGLCLLSSALRGTSGNRGSCEYICRANYAVTNGSQPPVNANVLSMKDLAAGDLLDALRKANVSSLKIEGRKKTPLYVAAVTNYYRKLLDRSFKPGEQQRAERDIQTIFSRPWTPFHLKNRRQLGVTDIHTVGHRGTEIGTAIAVVRGTPDRLRFIVRRQPLEKHDGIQVELSDRDRPFGFPVDDIRIFPQRNNDTWKNAFTAPVDATVEIALPDEHPDIPAGTRLFCASSQAVKRSYDWESARPALDRERYPLFVELQIQPQLLLATAHTIAGQRELPHVTATLPLSEPLQTAKQPERVAASAQNAFAKLGDSDFSLADFQLRNPDGFFLPASLLNELRRTTADSARQTIDNDLADRTRQALDSLAKPLQLPQTAATTAAAPRWLLKIDRPHFLNVFSPDDFTNVDEVIFSLARTPADTVDDALAELKRLLGGSIDRIRLSLPPIVRPETGTFTPDILPHLLRSGYRRWEASNIGSLNLLVQADANLPALDVTADWSLFVTNTCAAAELLRQHFTRLTLSPDDTWNNWSCLLQALAPALDVPVYQFTPLAYSDVCAMRSLKELCPGRKACTFTTLKLDNPRKDEHLIAVNNNCQTVILNQRPLNLSGHLHELRSLGARRFRADFCWLNLAPVAVRDAWRSLRHDIPAPDAWTANLFR